MTIFHPDEYPMNTSWLTGVPSTRDEARHRFTDQAIDKMDPPPKQEQDKGRGARSRSAKVEVVVENRTLAGDRSLIDVDYPAPVTRVLCLARPGFEESFPF